MIAIHIGSFPVQSNAGRNQIGKQVVKFANAAFFGVVGSQHFNVFLVRQGAGSQSGKHAFGAAFYKQAHAGIIRGFKLFNPFHGVGNLRDHKVFDFFRVAGVKFRRNVGGNRHGGRVESKRIQERAILRHGRAHNGGVESVRHRDLHRLNAHIGKHLDGVINRFAGAGNDRLGGAVFVGNSYITVNAGQFRLHTFHRGGDGGHLAVVFHFNFRHYLPAGAHGF